MDITVRPSTVTGVLSAPPSKSHSQRALAAALIRRGKTRIHNFGQSDDEQAALSVIQNLGASVRQIASGSLQIESSFPQVPTISQPIDCGESGLALRMFTPLSAILPFPVSLSGSGSLLTRPQDFFLEILPQLGVAVTMNNGVVPIRMTGPIVPRFLEVDGSLSSQFISGLLMAYSALNADDVGLKVKQLSSRAYVDLTLSVLRDFNLPCPEIRAEDEFYFSKKIFKAGEAILDYEVEGDWSNAAFLLVAGAICGQITLTGLNLFSHQADRRILEALSDCGSVLSIRQESVTVQAAPLRPFHFDATHCPDLFPPLVALAAYCAGTSVIEGVHRLIHKESNRAATLQSEFKKLGLSVQIEQDKMIIHGGSLTGAAVFSHHDHRVAMATAVAALGCKTPVTISAAEAVNKSYPDFFKDLRNVAVLC